MKEQIIQRGLVGEAPVDYFVHTVESGGASANRLQTKLKRGEFTVLVPTSTSEARILQFELGGLLPEEPKRQLGDKWIRQTPTAISTLARIVAKKARSLESPVLWVHEPMLNEDELGPVVGDDLVSGKVSSQRIEGQLYLVYQDGVQREAEVADAIDGSMLSWHFLAFLTEHLHEPNAISDLFDRSSMILVGAYDGESALIWERLS